MADYRRDEDSRCVPYRALRTGYAEMSAIRMGQPKQLAAGMVADSEGNGALSDSGADTPAGLAPRVPPVSYISKAPTPAEDVPTLSR